MRGRSTRWELTFVALAFALATSLTSVSSAAATLHIKSPQPVLLSQVGQSAVLYVLWTRNCVNDRSCYALERSDNGGRSFTRVSAPPISFRRGDQSGPLNELEFANNDDGLAVVQTTAASSLWVTFNAGTTWRRDVIGLNQLINGVATTSTTFYAVTSRCTKGADRSCGNQQLDSSPVSSVRWRVHHLPLGGKDDSGLPAITAYGNDVWLTTQEQGKPYKSLLATSYDGGNTFAVRSKPLLNSVAGCTLNATSTVTIWAQCDGGMMNGDIVYSHDGGATWSYGHGGLSRFGFGTFDPISTFGAVFVNYFPGAQLQGIRLVTTAASKALLLGRAPAKGITQLEFVDPEQGLALGHGYGVGDFATLYETSDGGKQWRTSLLAK
jgi:hypothetical protein